MMASILLILGVILLLWGVFKARMVAGSDPLRSPETCLHIAAPPRRDRPVATLKKGEDVLFGPATAVWTAPPEMALACGNPGRDPTLPGGDVPAGLYRVLDIADLSEAADPIRRPIGTLALILRPEKGGRDVLLHGANRSTPHSAGGIALPNRVLDALVEQLGDPRGLRVSIERRSIRRHGWGGTRKG